MVSLIIYTFEEKVNLVICVSVVVTIPPSLSFDLPCLHFVVLVNRCEAAHALAVSGATGI